MKFVEKNQKPTPNYEVVEYLLSRFNYFVVIK